jgi:hypothetical protein
MKRLLFVQVLVAALFLFAVTGNSWAIDLGFYAELGSGTGTYTIDLDPPEVDDDYDSSHMGVGFVMDEGSPEPLVNYRFQAGLEKWTINADKGSDADLTGLVISIDLGFSFTRQSPNLRVWAGPEYKAGFYSGDNEANENIDVVSSQYGPVVGMNLKLDSGKYLIVKAGHLIGDFAGTIETDVDDYALYGDITYTYIDIGLLF